MHIMQIAQLDGFTLEPLAIVIPSYHTALRASWTACCLLLDRDPGKHRVPASLVRYIIHFKQTSFDCTCDVNQ